MFAILMTIKFVFLFLTLTLFSVTSTPWHRYYNTYYSVKFPGKPVRKQLDYASHLDYKNDYFILKSDVINYQHVDAQTLQKHFGVSRVANLLNISQKKFVFDFATDFPVKILHDKKIVMTGIPGRDIICTALEHGQTYRLHYKLMIKNNRLYEVRGVSSNTNSHAGDTVERFIQSFQFVSGNFY